MSDDLVYVFPTTQREFEAEIAKAEAWGLRVAAVLSILAFSLGSAIGRLL